MALTKVKAGNILLTTPSASSNDVTPATTQYVTTALANLADSAPSTLNTLNELAAALGDDANFSTTVTNSIAAKAPLAGPTFTGDVDIDGSDDVRLRFLRGSTFKGGIQVPTSTGDMISGAAIDDLAIRSQANMLFSAGGNAERMRILSSGDVVIGGHNNPGTSGTIDLGVGSTSVSGGITLWNTTSAAHSLSFGDGYTGTDRYRGYVEYNHGSDYMRFGTGATERMRIDASGNVMIGKTAANTTAAGHTFFQYGRHGVTVTGTTCQIINRLGNDGTITLFEKDNSAVGVINVLSGRIGIGSGDTGIFFDSTRDCISPFTMTGNDGRADAIDIGRSGVKFKDLHLSGAVSSGSINNFKLLDLGSASMLITHIDRGTGTINSATHNTGFGYGAFNNLTEGDYNVAMGIEALDQNTTGSRNHAFGSYSLSSNVSGNYNTGCGYGTLNKCTSSANTAVGYEVLLDSNSGGDNTGAGYRALTNNTSGSGNTAVGYETLYSNTNASHNIGIGFRALYTNQGGANNIAIGKEAMLVANGGAENTVIGLLSGRYQTGSNYNTLYGSRAGYQVTSSQNVCIGAYGASNLTSGSGTVIIGYNAQPYTGTTANEIVIGFACQGVGAGRITIGVSNGSDRIYNNPSSNASWTRVSDQRYKDNIQDNTDCGLDFINDLRPVTFKFKALANIDSDLPDYDAEATERKHEEKHYGLIAQEVKQAMDDNNITDFAGWDNCSGIEAISQEMFVHPLIKAVQELSTKLEAAEARIATLEG